MSTSPPAATEPATTEPATTEPAAETTAPVIDDGSVLAQFAGQQWAFGTVADGATAADTSAEPIVIGMINQENSPVGSFPELRFAVDAAITWINTELGGVNGRPIRLETCITSFSVEQSQACAQELVQQGAVAVISGIDITSTGSLPVLEQNGIPMISAIPTTLAEYRSTNVFSFSGCVTGAYVAFAADAHAKGATSIAFAYGDFESFSVPATEYGARVAESLGMEVTLVPFPITTTDFLPVVQSIIDSGADAVTIGAADTACVPVMTILHDFGYDGLQYLVGACAAEEILKQVPDDIQAGVVFNSEGPPIDDDATPSALDGELFQAVIDRYATGPGGGAGTVSFRAMLNLWSVLTTLDEPTPAGIATAMRATVNAPSFWGHPFTCDTKQVPGFPALCSPQQTLFRLPDDTGTVEGVSDGWIDVPALLADAAG
ncbi:MAG: ABC transporter substrate-binding protein [Ilumatobacteraceae bacterium]